MAIEPASTGPVYLKFSRRSPPEAAPSQVENISRPIKPNRNNPLNALMGPLLSQGIEYRTS
jgi:hypothetical protein